MNWLFVIGVQNSQLGDQHLEDTDSIIQARGGDGVLEAGDETFHLDHDLVDDQLIGHIVQGSAEHSQHGHGTVLEAGYLLATPQALTWKIVIFNFVIFNCMFVASHLVD